MEEPIRDHSDVKIDCGQFESSLQRGQRSFWHIVGRVWLVSITEYGRCIGSLWIDYASKSRRCGLSRWQRFVLLEILTDSIEKGEPRCGPHVRSERLILRECVIQSDSCAGGSGRCRCWSWQWRAAFDVDGLRRIKRWWQWSGQSSGI